MKSVPVRFGYLGPESYAYMVRRTAPRRKKSLLQRETSEREGEAGASFLMILSVPTGPFTTYNAMKLLAIVLVILFCCFVRTQGLTEGEISALKDILHSRPNLGAKDPPWVADNLAKACYGPVPYGLRCSQGFDSHITEMYAFQLFWTFRYALPSPCPSC